MSLPPPRLAVVGAASCLAVLMAVRPAYARAPEAFVFSWQAPEDCPEAPEVRSEIVRLLGGSIGTLPGGRLQARAQVVTRGQGFAVVLETASSGNVGRRSLEADSCRELANATALIVALMIDPDAVAAHAPPPATPPAAPAPKPARILDFEAGIIVAATQGTLPSPDVGLGGIVGVSGRLWRLDLRASYGLRQAQKVSAPLPPGGQGQFSFFSALLSGCLDLGGPRVAWGPCGVGEFGFVSAKGVGVDRALPAHVPWWAVGAGAYAAIPLTPRWAIPLHFDVMLPLHRSEYVFRDTKGVVSARVYRAASLGVRASAGIELHF